MKFVVERDSLVDAVNWVSKSISNRPITTALLGIVIDASEEITLSGSDLETSTKAKFKAEVSQKGKVLVPGRLLAEISRSLPAKPISFVLEGTRVLVSAGSAKFTLPTLPLSEYPTLPELPAASGSINSDLFATAVNQVAIAAGKDDSLPTLTGVFVEINKNQITLAATDRYRLAVRELTWSAQDANIETTSLLRARTLADAAKSLIGSTQVIIALAPTTTNEKLVGFISDGKTMTSRVLDGSFPPFRHLLPNESTADAIIEVAPFLDSVRRVALVTDKTVPLRLNFSNNTLQLEAGTGDEAQASEKLDINYKGEDINIAFNPTYLTDGLTAINTAFVHISFTGANKPAVLTGQTEAGSAPITNYKYLLMPMRYSS
ncbi:DNA polymerase III subunit beta [Candidatus Nanopelagicus abundans]|uniref:Beta sliding clamp n=1 Tax=Candidatus Nanopelagicus abundans TaxID=1884916 RepID=A0A249L2M0_9ACTN|nr:DNA polymerase III subunit beta [Candidatus Nanopelagicus abundans]ASY23331.1 DNA polymerase III subunit beta [Candidatus Nanopelagicus abundans]